MKQLLVFLVLFPVSIFAQSGEENNPFSVLKSFMGEWTGKGEGESGVGDYTTSFTSVLSGQFIEIKTKAIYPATEKKPKGEVHEEIGYISYDYTRKKLILRQFHSEGFVNEYVLESISEDGKTITFITEQIENIPSGYKAKEIFQIVSDKQFTETFELAEPDKAFEVYTKTTFQRK